MIKTEIKLISIDDVKNFVKKANMLDCDAELSLGKYTVDAKSVMGIFSLDLSRPLELTVHGECGGFMDDIAEYIIK